MIALEQQLMTSSAQYEQSQRKRVALLTGQVTQLARNYRTLAETLRVRWA